MSDSRRDVQGREMVPGARGGFLLRGGNHGNRGGTGRPKSEVREAARTAFAERIPILVAIADDTNAPAAERIKALDLLARYGLGLRSRDAASVPLQPNEN